MATRPCSTFPPWPGTRACAMPLRTVRLCRLAIHAMGRPPRGGVPRHRGDLLARQQLAQLLVRMPGAERAEGLPGPPRRQVRREQPLDGRGHVRGRNAVAERTGRRLVFPDCPPDTEV